MAIHVTRGKHHHPIPKGMAMLIQRWLEAAGYSTDQPWKVKMGASVKATAHRSERRVRKITTRNTLEVFVKPGGNSTGRICYIAPPHGIDFGELLENMKRVQDE